MPITLKKIAYWGFAVAALIAALMSLVISFLDWNQYRDTLSDLASQQLDLRVELAGNVSVALFPRPSVSAETVRIAPMGQGNSDIIATADKISLRLGVASILKGQLAIQTLVLEGLDLALEQNASGAWVIRGWPAGDGRTAIDLNRLDIENGRLSLAPLGEAVRIVEKLNLRLTGALPSGPLSWDGNLTLDGQELETSGRLKPVLGLEEVSIKAEVAFAKSTLSASGRLGTGGDLTARLRVEGAQLGAAYSVLVSVATADADGSVINGAIPDIPYSLDLQLDIGGGIGRIVSRQLKLADTHGRLDLTIARKAGTSHIAGSLSLGVIDVDMWREAIPVASENAQEKASAAISTHPKISGALDVTVEGVRMNSGLGQRVDAVVSFGRNGPEITSMQALLPGATSLSLMGKMGATDAKAKVRVEVGNIMDLAEWVGMEMPAVIPPGRLSTASAKAVLVYHDDVWALTDLEGVLDTSKISGELSGDMESLVPSQARLEIDAANLDIFTVDRHEADAPLVQVPDGIDIGLDISVASLHGFDANLGKARFVGTLKPNILDVDFLSLEHKSGSLRIEGSLANEGEDVAVELTADFRAWGMQLSRFFAPEIHGYLLATNMEVLDGTASVAGVFSRMRLGLDAEAKGRSFSLSGEIGFPKNRLTFVNLQGALKHDNLAGAARFAGYGAFKQLPTQITYSLSKPATGSPFEAKIGGDLAGGKIQAEVSHFDGFERVSFSYDHENMGQLARTTGRVFPGFDTREGVRAEMSAEHTGEGWTIVIPSLKNGDRSVSGAFSVADNNRFEGVLNISKISIVSETARPSRRMDDTASERPNWFASYLHQLANYAGNLKLVLTDVQIAGQHVDAPAATFAVGDGIARLSLGAGMTINRQAATLDMDATLEEAVPFVVKSNFSGLEVASLLASEGVGELVTSSVAGTLDLKGNMADVNGFWGTLSGSGSFTGSAGQLKFLSVAGLASQIQTAQSGRGFLSEIGALLRRGETPFTALESRFTIDGGVALVENAKAVGDWGALSLDGQINLADRFVSLKGALALTNPPDVPAIPVQYEGPFEGPNVNWTSRIFERFVIAGIERRMRTQLFQDMEVRQNESGRIPQNPGLAVFSRAFGLLTQLKADQAEEKRKADEARRKAAEAANDSGTGP